MRTFVSHQRRQTLRTVLVRIALGIALVASNSARAASPQYSALPPHPSTLEWPTRAWTRATLRTLDPKALDAAVNALWTPNSASTLGRINALVLVQGGQIVLERFREGHSCDQVEHTMSVAKMMGAAMAGLLVRDSHLRLDDELSFTGWEAGDPRRAITPRHLLTMTSGLAWNDSSDFFEFAFGQGALDLAAYVAAKPLAHPPGTHFQYSDGTPSLIGELLRQATGGSRTRAAGYVRAELLEPLGMRHTELEFDRHGTWYGSSGVRWSPCDLARFGTLLLRDGLWADQRILPEGWVNFMRTPSEASLDAQLPPGAPPEALQPYGAYTDVYLAPAAVAARSREPLPIDAFGHYGFGGSHLRIVPSRDSILVIVGERGRDPYAMLETFRLAEQIIQTLPAVTAEPSP